MKIRRVTTDESGKLSDLEPNTQYILVTCNSTAKVDLQPPAGMAEGKSRQVLAIEEWTNSVDKPAQPAVPVEPEPAAAVIAAPPVKENPNALPPKGKK